MLQDLWAPIPWRIDARKAKNKLQVESRGKQIRFKVGDQVWVSRHVFTFKGKKSFKALFLGPGIITKEVNPTSYMVRLPGPAIHHHINAEFLKKIEEPIVTASSLENQINLHPQSLKRCLKESPEVNQSGLLNSQSSTLQR